MRIITVNVFFLKDMKNLYITKRGQVFEAVSMSIEMDMLGVGDRPVNWKKSFEMSMSERIGFLLQFMHELNDQWRPVSCETVKLCPDLHLVKDGLTYCTKIHIEVSPPKFSTCFRRFLTANLYDSNRWLVS